MTAMTPMDRFFIRVRRLGSTPAMFPEARDDHQVYTRVLDATALPQESTGSNSDWNGALDLLASAEGTGGGQAVLSTRFTGSPPLFFFSFPLSRRTCLCGCWACQHCGVNTTRISTHAERRMCTALRGQYCQSALSGSEASSVASDGLGPR